MAKPKNENKRKKKRARRDLGSAPQANIASGTETGAGAGPVTSGNLDASAGQAAQRTAEDEFANPPDPHLTDIGSKHGFIMSSELDHDTAGDNYEHTGSENREGMGSGSQAGPAHSGRSKPHRQHPTEEE